MKIKHIALSALVLTISLMHSSPAQAFDLGSTISGFFNQIGLSGEYIDLLSKEIEEIFPEEIGGALENVVKQAKGDLELPDVGELEEDVKDVLKSSKELGKLQSTTDILNAGGAKAHASGILSADGQSAQVEARENVGDAVEEVNSLANSASNAQVTQEVMKYSSQQLAQIAGILGENHAQLSNLVVTNAYSNRVNGAALESAVTEREIKKREDKDIKNTELAVMSAFTGLLGY